MYDPLHKQTVSSLANINFLDQANFQVLVFVARQKIVRAYRWSQITFLSLLKLTQLYYFIKSTFKNAEN